jgi:hypothetical protein
MEIDPDKDPMIYVFDILFDCKARLVDLTPEQDLKDYGHYMTGMQMMDEANMTQLVPCTLSCAQIAEHMSKGFHIRFVHDRDVLKMYEFTQNHLMRWAAALGYQSLNAAKAPIEELVKLDQFCSVIYEQAKFYDEPKLNSIEQRFGRQQSFGAILEMFNNSNGGGAAEQARIDNLVTKRRKGFSQLFEEYQMRNDPSIQGNMGLDIFARGLNDRV